METLNWRSLYHGQCPKCDKTLRATDELVLCSCGFRMAAGKFFARCKKGTYGYHKVINNSRTEDEIMLDICQMQ